MIVSFKSKPLKLFWEKGQSRKLPADDIPRIDLILSALNEATCPEDMAVGFFHCHALTGDKKGRYATTVNRNWRITFAFDEDGDAIDVDFEDYH